MFAIEVSDVPLKNIKLPVLNDVAFVPPSEISIACVKPLTRPPIMFV